MPAEVSRRDFLRGAEAIVLAAALNRAYAGVSPEDLAGDESFWNKIRSAYVRDPKILNLNNGGVAPTPTVVLDAEIDAIRYSNLLPSYRMWHDLEPGIEDARMLVGPEPNQSGAFGTIHFEAMDPGKLSDALLSKYNILVTPISAPSLNGIRVSPNVYTSTREIDQFCNAVAAIVPRA